MSSEIKEIEKNSNGLTSMIFDRNTITCLVATKEETSKKIYFCTLVILSLAYCKSLHAALLTSFRGRLYTSCKRWFDMRKSGKTLYKSRGQERRNLRWSPFAAFACTFFFLLLFLFSSVTECQDPLPIFCLFLRCYLCFVRCCSFMRIGKKIKV